MTNASGKQTLLRGQGTSTELVENVRGDSPQGGLPTRDRGWDFPSPRILLLKPITMKESVIPEHSSFHSEAHSGLKKNSILKKQGFKI